VAVQIDQGKCFGEHVLRLMIEVVSAAEESVASCHNSEAARFYRDLGANRIFLPRHLPDERCRPGRIRFRKYRLRGRPVIEDEVITAQVVDFVQPVWSRNGKELFYWSGEQIWVASYTGQEGSFRVEKPRVWSPGRVAWRAGSAWFDPHPDGKRFAVVAAASEETEVRRDKVVFITNFFDELHRIAPPAKR
jgi:hypothetical protein